LFSLSVACRQIKQFAFAEAAKALTESFRSPACDSRGMTFGVALAYRVSDMDYTYKSTCDTVPAPPLSFKKKLV
jgi:hypothetical protein